MSRLSELHGGCCIFLTKLLTIKFFFFPWAKNLEVQFHGATKCVPGVPGIYYLTAEHECTDWTLSKRDFLDASLSCKIKHGICSEDCLYAGWLCAVITRIRVSGFIPGLVVVVVVEVSLFCFVFFHFPQRGTAYTVSSFSFSLTLGPDLVSFQTFLPLSLAHLFSVRPGSQAQHNFWHNSSESAPNYVDSSFEFFLVLSFLFLMTTSVILIYLILSIQDRHCLHA